MSIKYTAQNWDNTGFQFHYIASHQNQPGELVELYTTTLHDALESRYIKASKIVSAPDGLVEHGTGVVSTALTTTARIVSAVPVFGTLASGLVDAIRILYESYEEHKITVKAKHFMDFASYANITFEDFINNTTKAVVDKHTNYIETLPQHKESIKWINKSLSDKLAKALDKDHNHAEKLVMTLAHAHAKIVIKAIETGLDPHYKVQNAHALKHAISITFADENNLYNIPISDHNINPSVHENTVLIVEDDIDITMGDFV